MMRRISHLFWHNPMLRWRLERGNVYTLGNLFIVLLLIAAVFLAWVRWDARANMTGFVDSLPSVMQQSERRALALTAEEAANRSGYTSSHREIEAFIFQIRVFDLYLIYFLCYILATSFRVRNRWGRVFDDEQVILPVTAAQRLLAMHDWPVLKLAACFVLVLGTLLLPSRNIWWEFTPFFHNNETPFVLVSLGAFAVSGLLAFHRLIQMAAFKSHRLPRRRFMLTFAAGAIVAGAGVGASMGMDANGMGSEPLRDWIMHPALWIAAGLFLKATFGVYAEIDRQRRD